MIMSVVIIIIISQWICRSASPASRNCDLVSNGTGVAASGVEVEEAEEK